MTEQINASLHPCLRGRWVTISFPQVPARFFGHLASHLGCQVNSMRQIPHKKPPFYKKTTKKVSYKIFSLNPFVEALHEQDIVRFKGSLMCSGDDEVVNIESSNPRDELGLLNPAVSGVPRNVIKGPIIKDTWKSEQVKEGTREK
ncbi:unnamed protein product [Porites lobata]|uniref:Uncharacterized protein n=1 Tax=Porites lobata TaxID=104759 RepID=A0ABN8N8R8_9CNID|nr:unnamed protein product [Porites lobata]